MPGCACAFLVVDSPVALCALIQELDYEEFRMFSLAAIDQQRRIDEEKKAKSKRDPKKLPATEAKGTRPDARDNDSAEEDDEFDSYGAHHPHYHHDQQHQQQHHQGLNPDLHVHAADDAKHGGVAASAAELDGRTLVGLIPTASVHRNNSILSAAGAAFGLHSQHSPQQQHRGSTHQRGSVMSRAPAGPVISDEAIPLPLLYTLRAKRGAGLNAVDPAAQAKEQQRVQQNQANVDSYRSGTSSGGGARGQAGCVLS